MYFPQTLSVMPLRTCDIGKRIRTRVDFGGGEYHQQDEESHPDDHRTNLEAVSHHEVAPLTCYMCEQRYPEIVYMRGEIYGKVLNTPEHDITVP